ncbi:hypothetical protein HYPSUDRAFT_37881 [Hypholoma sublateritium FD-334 SS-4]|uniref:Uncharacterized protein n=1 Tax=Hypholoma sublateritium (strain FD-334 SS-4) TaxID=945553 RepID=A0A0D2LD94_HYPSF|nr:hypothetical protein HYPSUDRAFT_37881 [Hypholoma sublateritium FD-334 SS-4]
MKLPIFHSNFGAKFNLDTSGVAGFFGGEEAFAAMNSVHFTPSRRWIGWYNSPGSYFVAKQYGTLPNSTFWDGLFPGPELDPTELLQLNDKSGLPYIGVYSGIQLPAAGYLSYLLSLRVKPDLTESAYFSKNVADMRLDKLRKGVCVTVVELRDFDDLTWPTYPIVPKSHFKTLPVYGALLVALTILFSLASASISVLYEDWFSFSMIALGVLSNGVASIILGAGVIILKFNDTPKGSPLDDGVLLDGDNIIILHGSTRVVNGILHSKYRLEYEQDPQYDKIGICSIILLAQFLLQLFLIPQGELIGQIFFLATLAMSWICNGYFASFNYDEIKTNTLFDLIGEPVVHYTLMFDKRSTAVAYTMFYFRGLQEPKAPINGLFPNNMPVWYLWKEFICSSITFNHQPSRILENQRSRTDAALAADSEEAAAIARLERLERSLGLPDKKFLAHLLREADRERPRAIAAAQSVSVEMGRYAHTYTYDRGTDDPGAPTVAVPVDRPYARAYTPAANDPFRTSRGRGRSASINVERFANAPPSVEPFRSASEYVIPQVQIDQSQPRWDARPPSPHAVQAPQPSFRVHYSSEDAPSRAYREPPRPASDAPRPLVHAGIPTSSSGVRVRPGYAMPPHIQVHAENPPQWDGPMPNYAQFVRHHNQRSVSP